MYETPEAASFQWLLGACGAWLQARTGSDARTARRRDRPGAATGNVIITLADHHGVAALLCPPDADDDPDDPVSPLLRARSEEAYYGTRIRNAEALDVLARVLEACRLAGKDVRILKGPAALAAVYKDIGLRPMADLDLLCRPDDLVAVARIARTVGFTGGSLYLHQVSLAYGGTSGGTLDLHFRLHQGVAGAAAFLDDVWAHPASAAIEEWTLPVLTAEQHLVFDVAHCVHHGLDVRLKQLVDIAGRLREDAGRLDPDHLAWLLTVTGQLDAFLILRAVAERWFGVPVPNPLVALVSPALTERTQQSVDRYETRMRRTALSVDQSSRHLAARGLRDASGPGAKLRYTWERLVPPLEALQAATNGHTRRAAAFRLPAYAVGQIVMVARAWWEQR